MLIQAQQLEKIVDTSEGKLQILQPINVSINAGETLPSLVRQLQSTLLSLLAGLDLATAGDVLENEKLNGWMKSVQKCVRIKLALSFSSFC